MIAWIVISAIVLFLCVAAFIAVLVAYHNDIIYEPDAPAIVVATFGVMACISLIIACSHYPEYNTEYIAKVADIVSISRDSEMDGHFTLGYGYVKEDQYYFYYYPTEKGIRLGKVKTDYSYIIETTEYTPSIYKVKELYTFNEQIYYNIYVPNGTVVNTFILN